MTTYTEINENITFVIKQHSPTRFETFRIYRDAEGQTVTLPVYCDSRKEANARRDKVIKMVLRSTK